MSINRSLLCAILLCIPFVLHVAVGREDAPVLDDKQPAAVSAADTLDPPPQWPISDCETWILGYLRWPGWNILSDTTRDSLSRGMSVRGWFSKGYRRPVTRNEDMRVLAWITMRITSAYTAGDNPVVHYNTGDVHSALIAVHYEDTLGRQRWALCPAGGCNYMAGWGPTALLGMQVFLHRPSNADVYAWMREYYGETDAGANNGFFDPQHRRSLQGSEVILLDASVRVNTWKHVTGEAPTMFFPNGR